MSPSILAILASLLFVPCVVFISINTLKQIVNDRENIGIHQSKMFIRVAIAEIIPLICIIGAFVQIDKYTTTNENIFVYFLALFIIVASCLSFLIFEYKQTIRMLKKKNDEFPYLNTLLPITVALAVAIPIVSFIILIIAM